MTKVIRPTGELEIRRKFSAEGFCQLDVLGALSESGYSKAEAHRLFGNGAVRVEDIKILPDRKHVVKYRRKAEAVELIEPDEHLYIGKHRTLTVREQKRNILFRLYRRGRVRVEMFLERFGIVWER
jgi:hypothetical protein